MRIYGYIKQLVELWMKKDGQDVKFTPNSNTYVGTTSFTVPPRTSGSGELVGTSETQTLTGKTIDGDDNTIQDLALTSLKTALADADKVIRRDASGVVISGNALPNSSAILTTDATQTVTGKTIDADSNTITNIENADIKAGAAIDATKIANGSVSNTEFQYLDGVTSAIQTQLDGKVTGPASATDEAVARFDLTTGKLVQNSVVTITDAGTLSGATQLNVDNLRLDGNTISSTDTNGNIVLDPNGTGITSVVGVLKTDTSLVLEDPGAGSNTITVQAPTLAGNLSLTLPSTNGSSNQFLQTNGSGVLTWATPSASGESVTTISNADYTVTDNDGYTTILMSTGATNRTLTLPTAADNTNRILKILKSDSGTGTVTIDGEGSETIDGALTKKLTLQYDRITIQCTGSSWIILQRGYNAAAQDISLTPNSGAFGTVSGTSYKVTRVGQWAKIEGKFTAGTVAGGNAAIDLPAGMTIDTTVHGSTNRIFGNFWVSTGTNFSFFSDGRTGAMGFDGSDTNTIYFYQGGATGNSWRTTAGNNTDFFATGAVVNFECWVAIAEWEG